VLEHVHVLGEHLAGMWFASVLIASAGFTPP